MNAYKYPTATRQIGSWISFISIDYMIWTTGISVEILDFRTEAFSKPAGKYKASYNWTTRSPESSKFWFFFFLNEDVEFLPPEYFEQNAPEYFEQNLTSLPWINIEASLVSSCSFMPWFWCVWNLGSKWHVSLARVLIWEMSNGKWMGWAQGTKG